MGAPGHDGRVFSPEHGHGTVVHREDNVTTVRFDRSGTIRRFRATPKAAKQHFERRDAEGDLRNLYGDKLHSDGSTAARQHLDQLGLAPDRFHRRVMSYMSHRGGVYVGEGTVTSFPPMAYLKGVRPRGWAEGSSWDQVPGVYEAGGKTLVLGTGRHGSRNLALHEFGHAVDHAHTHRSQSGEFRALHGEIDRSVMLQPYYRQKNGAGQEELFAELFALTYGDPQELRVRLGEQLATKVTNYFDQLGR